jgi:peptide/nickel transport system permease protein
MAVAETRAVPIVGKPAARPRSLFRQRLTLTLRNPVAILGLAVIVFWVLMAVFGPSLRPYNMSDFTAPPWSPPSADHWLGTDTLGRDIFVRIAYGAQLMLLVPTTAVVLAVLLGSTVGLVTGYLGGTVDNVVMRLMDIFLAFPILMLYLMIIVAIGPSVLNVLWAIAIAAMPGIARLVRGLTIELRSREFIAAAQMRGESSAYILFREILPNATGPILVDACVRIAYAMFATGTLGFLGLGVPPPTPDWGQMIADGRTWVFKVPWAPVAPLIAISSVVIAFNMIADAMRQAGWVD